jgi:cytochrome P450
MRVYVPGRLPSVDRDSPAWLADSGQVIDDLHRTSWLARSEVGYEFLSYDAVRMLLQNRAFAPASSNALSVGAVPEHVERFLRDGLLPAIDALRHQRIRRVLMSAFTARRIGEQRELIREAANALIDDFIEDGETDFVASFTTKLPIQVVSKIVGVPQEDIPTFQEWTLAIGHLGDHPLGSGYLVVERGLEAMVEYFSHLIEQRRRAPAKDLISAILQAQEGDEILTETEMIYNLVNLLMAGQDTTRYQLASAVLLFSRHPEQWRRLQADPPLAMNAVDEAMRICPAVRRTFRTPRETINVNGFTFQPGDVLVANMEAANRDPATFPDPGKFDIGRSNASEQLTFSLGPHFCLGAALSRTEQAEVLALMTVRLPEFEVVGAPEIVSSANTMGGPERLTIRFAPGPRQR